MTQHASITRMRDTACPLPAVLGLNREQAAAFVGISPSLFDRAVVAGTMPQPRMIGARSIWDVDELAASFKAIPHKMENPSDSLVEQSAQGNAWDNAREEQ